MAHAPEGKGGIARSLTRPLTLLPGVPRAAYATVLAWVIVATLARAWFVHRRDASYRGGTVLLAGLIAFAAIAFVEGRLAVYLEARTTTLLLTAIGWWGSGILALLCAGRLFTPDTGKSDRAVVALGILSFGIGYSFAVSWPLFENLAFPGLGVVVAVTLERPPSARVRLWRASLVLLTIASMGLAVHRKFTAPHSWGEWFEPPLYTARGPVENSILAGMQVSKPSAALYSAVAGVVSRVSRPGDAIYVYPNMPMLYAIAGRRPATYGLAHWVDVCPDFLGREDARRLLDHPPKVMVIRREPLSLVEREERLYRGGRRSSVRDVIDAVNHLMPLYERVDTFESRASARSTLRAGGRRPAVRRLEFGTDMPSRDPALRTLVCHTRSPGPWSRFWQQPTYGCSSGCNGT